MNNLVINFDGFCKELFRTIFKKTATNQPLSEVNQRQISYDITYMQHLKKII